MEMDGGSHRSERQPLPMVLTGTGCSQYYEEQQASAPDRPLDPLYKTSCHTYYYLQNHTTVTMSSDPPTNKRKSEDGETEVLPPEKRLKDDAASTIATAPATDNPNGVGSEEEIVKLAKESKQTHLVILDVRTVEEVLNDGFLKIASAAAASKHNNSRWLHVSCTPLQCPLLEAAAASMIPDKNTPIILYCKSGRRAGKAKHILIQQGYTSVLNAGGFKDLDYLQKILDEEDEE